MLALLYKEDTAPINWKVPFPKKPNLPDQQRINRSQRVGRTFLKNPDVAKLVSEGVFDPNNWYLEMLPTTYDVPSKKYACNRRISFILVPIGTGEHEAAYRKVYVKARGGALSQY